MIFNILIIFTLCVIFILFIILIGHTIYIRDYNSLIYALNVWNNDNNYKIFYNGNRCINLNKNYGMGYIPLTSYGYDNIINSFDSLLSYNDITILKKYFNKYDSNSTNK